jgi:CHASE3 domain sensor protein
MTTAQKIATGEKGFLLEGRKKYIKTVMASQEVSIPAFPKLQL